MFSGTFEAILKQSKAMDYKNQKHYLLNVQHGFKRCQQIEKKHFCENLDRKFSLAGLSLTIIELTVKAQKYS